MRTLAVCLVLLLSACASTPADDSRTRVVVISTMHFFHGKVSYYSYDDLKELLREVSPDVLAVELTEREVVERPSLDFKAEYPNAIFPVMNELDIPAVAMEPDEPVWSELVSKRKSGEAALARDHPQTAERFDAFSDALYALMFEDYWDSPLKVNSATTDVAFAGKHALQDALHDEDQYTSWHRWNAHFMKAIRQAAGSYPGGLIAVTVGLEHSYWLKREIAADQDLVLVPLEDLLSH